MPTTDLFKPYLWLAAVGFAIGFFSYVAVAPPQNAVTLDLPPSWAATVSAPAASGSGDWNFPKSI